MYRIKSLLIIMLLLGGGFLLFAYPMIANNIPKLGGTGLSFQACTDYSDGSQDCTNAINVPILSVTKTAIDVKLQGVSGSFTYQGTPKSWSFACAGTISFGNGRTSPITASASGVGPAPSNWAISLAPRQWNLSSIYGANYGQKNLTAQLGSKASPCSLTVTFNELPTPVTMSYQYASLAKWSVNYQASSVITSTSTTTSQATSTTSSQTSTTTTSSTTSGGNTVTTSRTDIWTTTITSASGGATGNTAPNGVIVSIAPDVYFQNSQSVMWVSAGPCAGTGGYFATLVTPATSITMGKITGAPPIAFSVAVTAGSPYLIQIHCADSAFTLTFNQVVYASAAQPLDAAPSPPFPPPVTTTTTSTATSTIGSDSATTTVCPYLSPSKCVQLSVVSVTF